jgi:hypothetical protein
MAPQSKGIKNKKKQTTKSYKHYKNSFYAALLLLEFKHDL